MNSEALLQLAANAAAWAKAYTAMTEALMREGVPEDKARLEARAAAFMACNAERWLPKPDEDEWKP